MAGEVSVLYQLLWNGLVAHCDQMSQSIVKAKVYSFAVRMPMRW